MRKLIALVLIAAAAWSGYWFIGRAAKFRALSSWIDARRADGWDITYSGFRIVGFPNRFDSRFRDLKIQDPVSEIGWSAPRFNILALSYQPNHIIAAFAHNQTLSFRHQKISIDSRKMLASVVFEPNTTLALERLSLRTNDLRLKSSRGWKARAQKLAISTRQSPAGKFAHEIVIDAKAVTPTEAVKRGLDPNNRLPATIDTLYLDMVLGFNAPWDRIAIERGAPEVTSINLSRMKIGWGNLALAASGKLAVAASGQISGKLDLTLRNWPQVLELFVTSGVFAKKTATAITTGLALLTGGRSKPAGSLSVALTLAGGQMFLGPIPLGPAPEFSR